MLRTLITLSAVLLLTAVGATAAAQQPLYIVNGEVRDDITNIPPDEIVSVERLPADEQTIARYGERAANGVLLVSLKLDEKARFTADTTFAAYIARHVKWEQDDPAARIVLRYRVTAEGRTEVTEELEATDKRLKRRVMKAVEEAPLWEPATKNGRPTESFGVLHLQLPEGKPMPPKIELIMRY